MNFGGEINIYIFHYFARTTDYHSKKLKNIKDKDTITRVNFFKKNNNNLERKINHPCIDGILS